MANGIVAGIFFEDEAGGVSESVFESAEPIEPFPDGGAIELLSLFTFWAVMSDGRVSPLDAVAIREIVFEVLLGVLNECRFGVTLIGQRERRVFGKDFLTGRASKANSPRIDDMN